MAKRSPQFVLEVRALVSALAELASAAVPPTQCSRDLAARTEAALRRVFKRVGSCFSQEPGAQCLGSLEADSYPSHNCAPTPALRLFMRLATSLARELAKVFWHVGRGEYAAAADACNALEEPFSSLRLTVQALSDANRR